MEPFYALSPQWVRCDRFYRVHADAGAMYGLCLGGQFFDKTSVRVQLFPLYLTLIGIPIVEGIASCAQRRRDRLGEQYDRSIAEPAAAISQDRRNFEIARSDIVAVKVSRRPSLWTLWLNSGVLTVVKKDGHRLPLILMYRQNLDVILEQLVGLGFPVTDQAA